MKKTYAIEVDCANCANLMEEAANTAQAQLLHQMIERVMEIACPEEDARHGA